MARQERPRAANTKLKMNPCQIRGLRMSMLDMFPGPKSKTRPSSYSFRQVCSLITPLILFPRCAIVVRWGSSLLVWWGSSLLVWGTIFHDQALNQTSAYTPVPSGRIWTGAAHGGGKCSGHMTPKKRWMDTQRSKAPRGSDEHARL